MRVTARTTVRLFLAASTCALLATACFKSQEDYDRSCNVSADCALLEGHCGCPIGAINASETDHARRDYTAAVIPVVFMIDCGGMAPCTTLTAQAECLANTCTMVVPDGGPGDGGAPGRG